MGVAGSGKSSVAAALVALTAWPMAEGDDFHPEGNRLKMARGEPLDDEDRWPWLDRIAAAISAHSPDGGPLVLTCSALKRAYRDRLARAAPDVVFVHLHGSRERLAQRIGSRQGHFMPPSLLESQLATLEPPSLDEMAITRSIEASPTQIAQSVVDWVRGRAAAPGPQADSR
ncbi:MAG: gluconokinase [Burkholderiaceae bacterium]|nr:gluconokinase [Burkholderiaceae bacterium]